MIRGLPAAATAAATVLALTVHGVADPAVAVGDGDGAGDEVARGDTDDWRDVVRRAAERSRRGGYRGRMMIVTLGRHGPRLSEIEIHHARDGELRVGRAEGWLVGRSGGGAFLWREDAGRLLTLGPVERTALSLEQIGHKYDVVVAGEEQLRTGPATAVTVREHGARNPRERLYVDGASGLVVRRETFGRDGRPRRLVAYTELEIADVAMPMPADDVEPVGPGPRRQLSEQGLRTLGEVGWAVPEELPGSFRMVRGYAGSEADGALHLVYSDGLYTLSLYEQWGRVDADALAGAVVEEHTGMRVWRWPGAEPERVVWSGGGRTFTAVSDAPPDEVVAAVAALPNDRPAGGLARLRRGLSRVASWLWPLS